MGNARSTRKHAARGATAAASLTAAYTPRDGVSFRGIRRKYSLDTRSTDIKHARHQSPVVPSGVSLDDSDCGFVSGSLSDWASVGYDADDVSVGGYSLLPNFSPNSLTERSREVMRVMRDYDHSGGDLCVGERFMYSTPNDAIVSRRKRTQSMASAADDDFLETSTSLRLRRQPFSVPADLNASVLTEEALRDCLNPDESVDFLRPGGAGIGRRTVSEMELIQSELLALRHEIDTMNDEVRHLHTEEQPLPLPPPISPPPLSPPPLRAVKRRRHHSRSTPADSSHDDTQEAPPHRWSYHHGHEFMWDYQSDLGTCFDEGDFIVNRPVVGSFCIGSPPENTPSYGQVRSFFERSHSLTNSLTDPRTNPATLSDIYIDDDIDHMLCGDIAFDNDNDNVANNNHRNVIDFRSSTSSPIYAVSPVCRKTAVVSPCQNVAVNGVGIHQVDDWHVENVMAKCNVYEYAEREWRGSSERAQTMKRAYHRIAGLFGLSNLRRVRADNYCVIRAVLYQLMVNNLAAQNKTLPTRQQVLQRLEIFEEHHYSYLQSWHFANRLPYSRERVVERVIDCVDCLYNRLEEVSRLRSYTARERHLQQLLNGRPQLDMQLCEAVKLLMQLSAILLHEDASCGNPVPVFAWLLFARESSTTPEALFTNHLNHIGDTTTVQQVEMYLLGHALGVKIEVARPSQLGNEDFVSHYPDDGADGCPKVYLIAEDERHYNVVVP